MTSDNNAGGDTGGNRSRSHHTALAVYVYAVVITVLATLLAHEIMEIIG